MRKNYQGGYITPETDLEWAVAERLISMAAARWRGQMVVVRHPETGEPGVDLDHSLEFSRVGTGDRKAADGYYWIGEISCPEDSRKNLDAMREGRESGVPYSPRNSDVRLRLSHGADDVVSVEAVVKLVDGRLRRFDVPADDQLFETVDTMFERYDSPRMVEFSRSIGASAWAPGPEDEV